MHRLLACLLTAIGAFPLLAAGTVSPFQVVPVTVVYPFTVTSSSLDKEVASRLGVLIANGMADNRGIVIKPGPPGTERKDYLTVARSLGADYYVTGYLTPFGNQVSLVEQVVTTLSGIVIFSNTAQLTTYADAQGQGQELATTIIRSANRNIESFDAPPPPAATPTPGPTAGSEANISGLFKHRATATASAKPTVAPSVAPASVTPAPTATPVAVLSAAAAQSMGFGLLAVGGSADSAARAGATSALSAAFATTKHPTTTLALSPTGLAGGGIAACNAASVGHIVSGSLTSGQSVVLGVRRPSASFELDVTDCTGKQQYHQVTLAGAADLTTAVQHAVNAAVSSYFATNPH